MVDPATGTDASDLIESATPQATQRLLRDLRAQKIELEMQNEELRHSQAERDASQAHFFDFYDMAPIGYCTVGETGLILQANLATAALIGVARVQLIQQPITRFIFPEDQDIYYLMHKRILGGIEPRSCELRMVKVDGNVFWVRLDASILPQSGTGSLRFAVTDITDTKLAESERLAAHRELAIEAQQKSQRAAELLVANQELAFEAQEKGQRAAELLVANQELAFEAQEKGKRAGELLAANEDIKRYIAELQSAFMSTVDVVMTLSEMRDPYTAGHERRVGAIAAAIGVELGCDERLVEGLKVAGHLHDIGKISVPSEILSLPGRLSPIQMLLIREHAQAGYDVLKHVEFPWPVALVALQHHERVDGSGYPQGLKGDAILLEARIIAVADVVEAMSSHRPYRAALGLDAALAEIKRGRSTAYDPVVADACLRLFTEKAYTIPA